MTYCFTTVLLFPRYSASIYHDIYSSVLLVTTFPQFSHSYFTILTFTTVWVPISQQHFPPLSLVFHRPSLKHSPWLLAALDKAFRISPIQHLILPRGYKMPLFSLTPKTLAGPGYVILNIIRALNILGLTAVITSSIVMVVKTVMTTQLYFFDGLSHMITAFICGMFSESSTNNTSS